MPRRDVLARLDAIQPEAAPVMDTVTLSAETYMWLLVDVAAVAVPALVATAIAWFVATNLRDVWRALKWFVGAIRNGYSESDAAPASAESERAVRLAEPPRLAREVQWSRVADVVTAGLGRARSMEKLHGDASRQLDAALYGLRRLNGDIRALSPIREAATPERIRVRWLRARLVERRKDAA